MIRYRPEIDGLRAVAVLPVILFHAGFPLFAGGFVGVDVFFVISGYLITTILLKDMEAGSFSIVHFYERRARRILPALFVVMFASLPFAWLWLLPLDLKDYAQSIVTVSMFASNLLFWRTSGYFDTTTELKPLLHTWSLSVEEQYYVLFPLFLLLAWRLGRRWIAVLLVGIAAVSIALAEVFATRNPPLAFYLLPTRAWELMIGALVAFYYTEHNIRKHGHLQAQAGSLIGLALIAYAIVAYNSRTPFPSVYALVPTVGAALIIVFSTRDTLVGKLLSSRLFVGVGLISYSAYLWHQPLFAFARHRSLGAPGAAWMAGLAVASLPLAYLTWRYIERPFRNKHQFTRRQVFSLAGACTAFFILVGAAGHLSQGFESRLPAEQRDLAVFGQADVFRGSRDSDGSCGRQLALSEVPEEVCITNSSAPKILVAGDSHAMALYSSVFAGESGLAAQLVGGHACPLYPDLRYTPTFEKSWDNNCDGIAGEVLRIAGTSASIDTVVLVNVFANVTDTASRYRHDGAPLTHRQAFRRGYDALVGGLLQRGKRVVFVIGVPHMKYDSRKCIQKLPGLEDWDCRFTLAEHQSLRSDYLAEVSALKERHPELIVYDPAGLFCTGQYCEVTSGNKSLYNDRHHVSVYASGLILKDMERRGVIAR